jgi:DNA-binding IclR family transcriptional regulator
LIVADRDRGFAVSRGFYERGVAAVAAPVRDASLRIVAAINATAPAGERDAADLDAITAAVVRAANAISAQLGASARSAVCAAPSSLGESSWV